MWNENMTDRFHAGLTFEQSLTAFGGACHALAGFPERDVSNLAISIKYGSMIRDWPLEELCAISAYSYIVSGLAKSLKADRNPDFNELCCFAVSTRLPADIQRYYKFPSLHINDDDNLKDKIKKSFYLVSNNNGFGRHAVAFAFLWGNTALGCNGVCPLPQIDEFASFLKININDIDRQIIRPATYVRFPQN